MKRSEWKDAISAAIYGAFIAQQVQDFMNSGKGAPGPVEMRRFAEEAGAVADLWREVVPTPSTYGVRETS